MKFISLFLFFCSPLPGQQIRSALWTTDQFVLRYRTMMEPARPAGKGVNIGGGGADDSTTNHRILMDHDQKKYFGYDLQVAVLGNGRFQLNFKRLTVTDPMKRFFDADGSFQNWTEILLPSVPASMSLSDGETVALDLMTNPATGEKIVEYISVSASSGSSYSRRDLQMGDIQMSLGSPQLYTNGKHWQWNQGDAHGAARGSVLWIYLPDRGRFLLSFVPHAELGFKQAGEGRGNQIKFSWNGETFELKGGERILPADGTWNVYVYQDRGYQPGYPPVLYGASDKPESLLHR
jgi:hypothetical protein